MEHLFFKTTAVAVMTAAALIATESTTTPLPCSALSLPLAIENAEVKARVEAGMADLLMGWEEHARVQFAHAIELGAATESTSLIAYCGMMLASERIGEKDANRMQLAEYLEKVPTTPVETFYLNAFLKMAGGDIAGAAQDFEERAGKYRRDIFSALWASMLYHCSDAGYDALGRATVHQSQALKIAQELYKKHRENPLVCYVRAYIEESAPTVSAEAMEAAKCAVEGMPQHPMPRLLYGHLLYRNNRADEAAGHFAEATRLSASKEIKPAEMRLQMIARLYESTALWSAGRVNEALTTGKSLIEETFIADSADMPALVLQRWEARTLPLRVLVMRAEAPSIAEIRAAADAATLMPPQDGADPVLHVRDCLRAALYARMRMKQNNTDAAYKSLKLAREALAEFEATRAELLKKGSQYITPWHRAYEACRIAILVAGADVFPEDDPFWKTVVDSVKQPVYMLMPPVIPVQFQSE